MTKHHNNRDEYLSAGEPQLRTGLDAADWLSSNQRYCKIFYPEVSWQRTSFDRETANHHRKGFDRALYVRVKPELAR